jgi:hypothetical protein
MSLHFKNGVNLRGLQPQAVLALVVASETFAEVHEDCLVTSAVRDGTFQEHGFHATGQAVDIAVRRLDGTPIPAPVCAQIVRQLGLRIGRLGGGQYDVVDEMAAGASPGWTGAHIHIEFDPK